MHLYSMWNRDGGAFESFLSMAESLKVGLHLILKRLWKLIMLENIVLFYVFWGKCSTPAEAELNIFVLISTQSESGQKWER